MYIVSFWVPYQDYDLKMYDNERGNISLYKAEEINISNLW